MIAILQIYRERLVPGSRDAYNAIEDQFAVASIELSFPHAFLALTPIDDDEEVWWLNAYATQQEVEQVPRDYAANPALVAAFERLGPLKKPFVAGVVETFGNYRPDLSEGPLDFTGARFVAVTETKCDGLDAKTEASGAVFDGPDGTRVILRATRTLEDATRRAAASGKAARVFAVRPNWGKPERAWMAADPEFWAGRG